MSHARTLRTARLLLRRGRLEDAADLHAVFSDPRAMRFWSTPPHANLGQTQDWVAGMVRSPPEESDDFVIEMDGRVVGKAGFWRLPEIGYILAPGLWGQGLMSEALRAVLCDVFERRRIAAATADVDPRNAGSLALLARLGFVEAGRAANTYEVGGAWVDSIYLRLDNPLLRGEVTDKT